MLRFQMIKSIPQCDIVNLPKITVFHIVAVVFWFYFFPLVHLPEHEIIHGFQTIFMTAIFRAFVVHTRAIDDLIIECSSRTYVWLKAFKTYIVIPAGIYFWQTVTYNMSVVWCMSKIFIID